MVRINSCLQYDFFSTHRETNHRPAAPSLVRHCAQQDKIYLQVWELLPADRRTVVKCPTESLSLFSHHWTGNQRCYWWHQILIFQDRNLGLPNLKLPTPTWTTKSVMSSWSIGVRMLSGNMENGTDITESGCTGEQCHQAPFPLTSCFFFTFLNSLQDLSLWSFLLLLQPTLSPGLIMHVSS